MHHNDQQGYTVLTHDLLPVATDRDDRLPPMLFVATMFYALIILGITFDIGIIPDDTEVTSLEVTIVADTNLRTARPDRADYLAQANQQGNGNTREKVNPGAAPTAPGEVEMPVDAVGPVQLEAAPGSEQQDMLLTTTADANRLLYLPDEIDDDQAEQAQEAQALPSGLDQTLPLPEDDDATLLITDDNPRHLVVSVNSAQSDIAPYLNAWKRRVERIGTLNFPTEIDVDGLAGSPTLQISIAPDGRLAEALIMRSSGHVELDRAAMAILSRASPFERFPEHLREQYDRLIFAYKFKFRGADFSGTVSAEDPAAQGRGS